MSRVRYASTLHTDKLATAVPGPGMPGRPIIPCGGILMILALSLAAKFPELRYIHSVAASSPPRVSWAQLGCRAIYRAPPVRLEPSDGWTASRRGSQ
eukprot:scaffold1947_cov207-Prasinococcus_capsulatus_cf.AAC.13